MPPTIALQRLKSRLSTIFRWNKGPVEDTSPTADHHHSLVSTSINPALEPDIVVPPMITPVEAISSHHEDNPSTHLPPFRLPRPRNDSLSLPRSSTGTGTTAVASPVASTFAHISNNQALPRTSHTFRDSLISRSHSQRHRDILYHTSKHHVMKIVQATSEPLFQAGFHALCEHVSEVNPEYDPFPRSPFDKNRVRPRNGSPVSIRSRWKFAGRNRHGQDGKGDLQWHSMESHDRW